MKEHIRSAYDALTRIFKEGTYSGQAMFASDMSALSSRIILGVLERNVTLEYVLGKLVDKKPKENVYIILKIGAYMLLYIDKVPSFATVNECVEFTKSIGKGGVAGFVNAVLKKIATNQFAMPAENDKDYLSITYSKPEWFIKRMLKEYGKDKTVETVSEPVFDLEHVRVNQIVTNSDKVLSKLSKSGANVRKTNVGGFVVKNNDVVKSLFKSGEITFQSPSSMLAVQALQPQDGKTVLDLCAAPGGKTVYLAELCPHSTIVACDLHPHRVELIKRYAERMQVPNVKCAVEDASVLNQNYVGKFDYVLLDAPCTCFGTFQKHPDVFLQRGEDEINKLAAVQRKILYNAIQYLSADGVLVYSTCTLFHEENLDNVKAATDVGLQLEKMPVPIANEGVIQLLPHEEWDGFFVARLRRVRAIERTSTSN